MTQPEGPILVRGIRRWDLVAIVINGIIGAGIFGLPSKVYALIGPYSIAAFLICAFVVSLIVLCFAEVGSRFTETGGPYLYAREAFGPGIGFEVGWLLWLTRLTSFAANCNLLTSYAGHFFPGAAAGLWRVALVTAVVLLLTVINLRGVRETALAINLFTIGKLIPILLFITAGLFFIKPSNFETLAHPDYGDFSTSVLLLIYAFTGFEVATVSTGESRDPKRDLPFALLLAIGAVATVYVLIQLVCVGTFPELASSERPLVDAAGRFLGTTGAAIIATGALVSTAGNLNANLLAGSRLPFAMAEQRQLPRVLSKTHNRYRTPHVSILLTAAIMLTLTLSGSFIYALTLSTITRLLTYSVTCAALPILRFKRGASPAGFRLPWGIAISAAALMLAVWLLSNSTWREARDVTLAASLGLLIYVANRFKDRSSTAK
jgi:basic amino acid/polyamine antiporter, APA family